MIINIVIGVAIVYAAYGILLYLLQRSMLFPGTSIAAPRQSALPDGGETVLMDLPGGPVEAWYFRALTPEQGRNQDTIPTVLFAHGNYETMDLAYETVCRYRELGVHLLLVEYPGYGRSKGSPSEESITGAMVKAYDWLVDSAKCNPEYIFGHGRSVGGGAVCALSRKRSLRGIILQSTFTSVKCFAGKYLMPSFLVRDEFNNLEAVRQFSGPVLLIHGNKDNLVPFSHARANAAANPRAKLVSYHCSHNNCPPMDKWDDYWAEIGMFVTGSMQQ